MVLPPCPGKKNSHLSVGSPRQRLADRQDDPGDYLSDSDHRKYNRKGKAFDVGETFAGVPFETGLEAVENLRPLVPEGFSMAQFALRWILMNDAVSPGYTRCQESPGGAGQRRRLKLAPAGR